ncbi:MAG TPA: BrxA/BrxB family bacilliredoxin [Caldithrix sp.]|mgnify:CR=1 FL=1|nr:BrxA/BrxB family bacilliredoxin [Calditrichaceae bacterium]HEM49575.1 BrxA/BrxB family bacilliredoxin [Caldithrix sp.]
MFQTTAKYPAEMVKPMREELTSTGVEELLSSEEVDNAILNNQGSTLLVINSVCGCAAGNARPAVKLALNNNILPDRITTVFAGVDHDAVAQARSYIQGYPPSSPSVALFKQGKLVHFIPRHQIEGRLPEEIAGDLIDAFNKYCSK